MILQSLVRYYEILSQDGVLPKPGYCLANISYALNISEDGTLLGITNMKKQEQRGKKMADVPQTMEVPELDDHCVKVFANFICDNSTYLLGMDGKGKPERTLECFAASRELHKRVLSGVNTKAARAVLAYFEKWNPKTAAEHPAVAEKAEKLMAGGNLIFMIDGGDYAHKDPEIRKAWEAYRESIRSDLKMPCLVTGKYEPVAILHGKIRNVQNAPSYGASLVSFNDDAYESYGHNKDWRKGQGLNAPVGEYAAFAYVTALNYLLADRDHRISIGDTTVVFWAESVKPEYRDMFTSMVNPQNEDANKLLISVMKKLKYGKPIDENISLDMPFYILGLAPNAARISVRFFLQNSFGSFLDNVKRYYDDVEIDRAPFEFQYLTPYWMLRETVNPNAKDKSASPQMAGETMRAVLMGTPYPQSLMNAAMLRVRAEQDDEDKHTHKITRGRAAIFKAFLNRQENNQNYEEVLSVSLRDDSIIKAYVLGRIFAVLEKTQRDANPGLNSTIKDRYFNSACATPGSVFPTLFKLYENHIEKIRKAENGKGLSIYNNKLISELMGKLDVEEDPFPAQLSLNDQAIFVLGYYHQVQSIYTPKDKKQNNEEE